MIKKFLYDLIGNCPTEKKKFCDLKDYFALDIMN